MCAEARIGRSTAGSSLTRSPLCDESAKMTAITASAGSQ